MRSYSKVKIVKFCGKQLTECHYGYLWPPKLRPVEPKFWVLVIMNLGTVGPKFMG